KMVELCNQQLPVDHYYARSAKSVLAVVDWYATLTKAQRAEYQVLVPIAADARQALDSGESDVAAEKFKQLLESRERLGEPRNGCLASQYVLYARALGRSCNIDASICQANKAYEIARRSDGDFSPLSAQILIQVGQIHNSLGEDVESVRDLTQA